MVWNTISPSTWFAVWFFFKNFMKVVGQTMPHTYISVNTIQVAICTGMQRILIIYTLCKWSMPAKSESFAASIFDDRNILRSPVYVCIWFYVRRRDSSIHIQFYDVYWTKMQTATAYDKKRSAHLAQNQNTTHLGQPFTSYNQEYSNGILCIFCTYYLYTMY